MPGYIDPSKHINAVLLKEFEQEISKPSAYDSRIVELLQYYKETRQRERVAQDFQFESRAEGTIV